VTAGINATRWQVLDRLAMVTDGENAAAAQALLKELRSAARHDEHEVGLAETLQQVEQRATALFLDAASKREPLLTTPESVESMLAATRRNCCDGCRDPRPGNGRAWSSPRKRNGGAGRSPTARSG
jgi:hypothetical protein